MKKFPEFENILPSEPEYDSWLWDGTKPREHELKKRPQPENKDAKKQPNQKLEKKEQSPEKEKPKESQLERSKTKTPEQREEDRETIVEKSLQLKRHFENEPLPNDPRLVARILVAEHILTLNEQLEEQHPRRKDVSLEELSIALDYMGSLAEKLEDPSVEAAPDIEEAYTALIELTEEALQTTTPEKIIEHATNTIATEAAIDANSQPDTPSASFTTTTQPTPIGHSKQAVVTGSPPTLPPPPSKAAAILVTTLAALPVAIVNQQKQLTFVPPALSTPRPQETGGYYPAATSETTVPLRPSSPAEIRSAPFRPATRERQNSRGLPSATPIAAIALTAAIANSPERPLSSRSAPPSPEKSTPQEASYVAEVAKTAQSIAAAPSPTETIQHARETMPSYTPESPIQEVPRSTAPPPSHEVVAAYTKKLEHLPLHTLLTIAENVPLGYGRYLRQEFENNQIDKAGLIKVLKARAKGRDFSTEYREQTARFRSIKSSPEFLHTSAHDEPFVNDTITQSQPALEPKPAKPTVAAEPTKVPKTFIDQVKATATRISSQEDIPSLPQASQTPWIIAIIIALIILTAILIFMF